MSCVVILTVLCLHNVATVEVSPPGTLQSATARVERSLVSLMLSSDSHLRFDWQQMSRACVGDSCIAYHKHCRPMGREFVCSYHLMRPNAAAGFSFEITAPNRTLVADAERQIEIFVEPSRLAGQIPLTEFRVESEFTLPELCETVSATDSCRPERHADAR